MLKRHIFGKKHRQDDGQVRPRRRRRRGQLRRRHQMPEPGKRTDRRHQEVSGDGRGPDGQEDRDEGNQDAEGEHSSDPGDPGLGFELKGPAYFELTT